MLLLRPMQIIKVKQYGSVVKEKVEQLNYDIEFQGSRLKSGL